jgi:hypothetical protein
MAREGDAAAEEFASWNGTSRPHATFLVGLKMGHLLLWTRASAQW